MSGKPIAALCFGAALWLAALPLAPAARAQTTQSSLLPPWQFELHTGDSSRSAVSHAGFRVELVSLQPYPFSSRTIGPDEYRATLKVSR
jgi:putative intracellular protease/amidase